MPTSASSEITEKLRHFSQRIQGQVPTWINVRTPVAFRDMELEIAEQCREIQDEITAAILQEIVKEPQFEAEATVAAREVRVYKNDGRRAPKVTLLGGHQIELKEITYLKAKYAKQPGRKRTKRGKAGTGLYPVLAALGIAFMVTPALAAEVCRQIADSDSLRAGRAALARRGIDLGHDPVQRIVNHCSHRAIEQRTRWLESARASVARRGLLSGKRVVTTTDGGRLRVRYERPGRRLESGYHGFDAPWKEPKLFVIYVVDHKGDVVFSFRPVCDGTMGDCDAVFRMLTGYLRALGAHDAKQLIILGDGAKWIWERVDDLAKAVGIDQDRVKEVIDWYHAVETLNTIASVPKWADERKAEWTKKAKDLLYKGKIDELVDFIGTIAVGRNAKEISKHIDYFARNAARMQYKAFKADNIPLGSGAVESAVRRVINLRLKSNAKYWKELNAEGMILFRAYLKADRFDDLFNWSIATAANWWADGHGEHSYTQSPVMQAKAA